MIHINSRGEGIAGQNRRFLPNLHTVRVTDGKGNTKRMCLCAKCIKSGKVAKA